MHASAEAIGAATAPINPTAVASADSRKNSLPLIANSRSSPVVDQFLRSTKNAVRQRRAPQATDWFRALQSGTRDNVGGLRRIYCCPSPTLLLRSESHAIAPPVRVPRFCSAADETRVAPLPTRHEIQKHDCLGILPSSETRPCDAAQTGRSSPAAQPARSFWVERFIGLDDRPSPRKEKNRRRAGTAAGRAGTGAVESCAMSDDRGTNRSAR